MANSLNVSYGDKVAIVTEEQLEEYYDNACINKFSSFAEFIAHASGINNPPSARYYSKLKFTSNNTTKSYETISNESTEFAQSKGKDKFKAVINYFNSSPQTITQQEEQQNQKSSVEDEICQKFKQLSVEEMIDTIQQLTALLKNKVINTQT